MDETEAIQKLAQGMEQGYPSTSAGQIPQHALRRVTRKERLEAEVVILEKRLVEVKRVLGLLNQHPELSEVLEAIDRVI